MDKIKDLDTLDQLGIINDGKITIDINKWRQYIHNLERKEEGLLNLKDTLSELQKELETNKGKILFEERFTGFSFFTHKIWYSTDEGIKDIISQKELEIRQSILKDAIDLIDEVLRADYGFRGIKGYNRTYRREVSSAIDKLRDAVYNGGLK